MTLRETLEKLDRDATPGPWQVYAEHSPMREQRCTIIANVDGEIVEGSTHYSYQFCAQTLNEFAEGDEFAERNAAAIVTLRNAVPEILALFAERDKLREQVATLQKRCLPQWFYLAGDTSSDRCRDGIYEVIDEDWLYDNQAEGSAVIQIECATSCPDIWAAVRFFTDEEKYARDSDEDYEYTEHPTEAQARAALEGTTP